MRNIQDYFPDVCVNDNASDAPAFSILPIVTPGGQLLGADDNDVAIKADKASSTAPALCAIVGPVAIRAGKPGKCNASGGLVLFAYDTGTPALGDKYGPKSGQWTATKDGSPACITAIYVVDSTNKIALGFLSQSPSFSAWYGSLDADLTAASPTGATISIYTGDPPGSDTTENLTGVACDGTWIGSGKKLASGSKVCVVQVYGGAKLIIAGPCGV
jgi:hypothetical protein